MSTSNSIMVVFIENSKITKLDKSIKIKGSIQIFGHGNCIVECGDYFLPISQISIEQNDFYSEIALPTWLNEKIVNDKLTLMHGDTATYMKKNISQVTIC